MYKWKPEGVFHIFSQDTFVFPEVTNRQMLAAHWTRSLCVIKASFILTCCVIKNSHNTLRTDKPVLMWLPKRITHLIRIISLCSSGQRTTLPVSKLLAWNVTARWKQLLINNECHTDTCVSGHTWSAAHRTEGTCQVTKRDTFTGRTLLTVFTVTLQFS